MSLTSIHFLNLTNSEIEPKQDFHTQVTKARSKVKSRSHHDVAQLHPLTNVPNKYQHLPLQGFRIYSPDNLFPTTHLPIWIPWVKIPAQPLKAVERNPAMSIYPECALLTVQPLHYEGIKLTVSRRPGVNVYVYSVYSLQCIETCRLQFFLHHFCLMTFILCRE